MLLLGLFLSTILFGATEGGKLFSVSLELEFGTDAEPQLPTKGTVTDVMETVSFRPDAWRKKVQDLVDDEFVVVCQSAKGEILSIEVINSNRRHTYDYIGEDGTMSGGEIILPKAMVRFDFPEAARKVKFFAPQYKEDGTYKLKKIFEMNISPKTIQAHLNN